LFLIVALAVTVIAQTRGENASAAGQSSLHELLKLVPDEAALVVTIPSLADVATGLNALGAVAGIDDLTEIDADSLFDDLAVADLPEGWRERINLSGPVVFAVTEPDSEPLLICTVTEPGDAPPNELVQLKGKVVIVAPDAEVMELTKSASGGFAKRFEQQAGHLLKEHDLAVLFDVPSWATRIEQMITAVEAFAQVGAQMGVAAPTTQAARLNLAMANWLLKTLRTALDEAETFVFAARFNAEGVHVSELAHFQRTGKVAGYLGKVRKPDKDLLRGLSAQRGMAIFAGEWTLPADVMTFSEKMLEVLLAASPDRPADDAEWTKLRRQGMELYRRIAGYSGVLTLAGDSAGLIANGLYLTENPQAVLDGMLGLFELSRPVMNAAVPGFSMEMSEQTETIGSVRARVGHVKFEVDNEEMQRVLKRIYGESTTFYVAPHPEGVAYAMGPADVARGSLEQLLAGSATPLSDDPRVADALKKLSPKPQMLLLLDLPGLLKWTMEFATTGAAGAPAPEMPELKLPETPLPYVSFGLYLRETACGVELFLPAKTLQVIVEWFKGPAAQTPGSEPY